MLRILTLPQPPRPTPFPYTTLFRSWHAKPWRLDRDRRRGGIYWGDDRRLFPRIRCEDRRGTVGRHPRRSEEHTSELQSRPHLVCRLLVVKKNITKLTDMGASSYDTD